MDRRVFLHVGSPKTGSTFLQQVLWSQRQLAQEQGLLLPLDSFDDHFLASADVRGLSTQERFPPRAVGIWGRIVEAGLGWDGDVLVSHELLAAATAEQCARAVLAWGGADVHVIVTARDLVRQIPAEWQEHIKHRSSMVFTEFVDALRSKAPAAEWFWTVQDYADVCRRWSAAVPPDKVHVVTVPARDAAPDVLWNRFAKLVGLEPGVFDLTTPRANVSLRAEQAELLRRVNALLGKRLPLPGAYATTVKELFAQEVLAGRPGRPVSLSDDDRAFALKRSEALVAELETLGDDVVGDLAELIPTDEPSVRDAESGTDHPEATPEEVMLTESLEALADLLERFSDRSVQTVRTQRRLQRELDQTRAQLADFRERTERLEHDMRYRPLRHLAVGQSERRPWLMKVRVGYRRTAALAGRLRGLRRRG